MIITKLDGETARSLAGALSIAPVKRLSTYKVSAGPIPSRRTNDRQSPTSLSSLALAPPPGPGSTFKLHSHVSTLVHSL